MAARVGRRHDGGVRAWRAARGRCIDDSTKEEYQMPATASAETRIGHVHLKVTDLERSVDFYTNILGFELTTRYGSDAAFMSYGGYHHHLGLNTWHSKGAGPAPVRAAGLYHFAILYPTRKDLANALKRVLESGWDLDGA